MKLTHWSYSFLLQTCNLGDAERIGTNPFTGETARFPVDEGLTDEEIEAVEEVFDRYGIEGPEPDFEGYAVYGSHGDTLRFRCYDLDDSGPITGIPVELTVRRLSDPVLSVILEVARAGNLALMSDVGNAVRIVDRTPDARLLSRWPDGRTIRTTQEFRTWLEKEIGAQRVAVRPWS